MFHLRLFGSPALELDDIALTGRAVQRHRIAMLALLALAPARRMSRDKLIGYLWPERDTDSSRNLLKQATYVLRAELGENALLSEGDDLQLNDRVVTTDAAEFAVAITQLDFLRATRFYRGPFMDGFFLSGATEFEEWVSQERRRLADAYASALEHLADAAETAKDWAAAAEWWKKRATQDLYDTRVALRLMQALDAGGSRASALQHGAIHRRCLKEEFGIDAPPELTAAIERLHQPAPALTPAAEPIQIHEAVSVPDPGLDAAPTPVAAPRRKRWFWLAAPVGALVILAASFWTATPDGAHPEPSIVVLPFDNPGAAVDRDYFSDGLTEEIISRLSSLDGLKVISRTSAMHYKDTRKPMREIAEELNVAHVLEGSVRYVGDRIRITTVLIDAATDRKLWARDYEFETDDVPHAQEEIARAVAKALELKLGTATAARIARRGTDDPAAYEFYQRGRWLWTQRTPRSVKQAIHYFDSALARDSSFADAYAGLADAYVVSYQLGFGISEDSAYSRLVWAAERALALDETSAAAHASASNSLLWQSNWPGALRESQRAVELNPGDASARGWQALILFGMGRLDEAREEARRAYETDPFAVIVSLTYANANYLLRDYDAALDLWRKTLELNPDWWTAVQQSAIAYSQQGRHPQAVDAIDDVVRRAPRFSAALADAAYVYARAGKTADAREFLTRAKNNVFEPFYIGRAHVGLGEPDSAFVWLERSNWKWPWRGTLYDPALDPLRNDPRFHDLTARVQRRVGLK
jgi:TolB-like protein/DNA-binding SARP family transcriptional activator/tetratricopeptide (TPR) repeat protein